MAEKGFGVKEVNLIGASGTPTITSPNNLNLNANNVAISTNVSIGGTLSVTGNVSVGGTLTYEDVTNIDSVGLITARSGLIISGVTTFNTGDVDFKGSGGTTKILFDASQDQLELADSTALTFGDHTGTGDYSISYVNGSDFTILGMNGGSGDLVLGTYALGSTTKTLVSKRSNNALELYFANNKKLETTNTGIDVTGAITVNGSALSITPTDSDIQVAYTVTANGSSAYRFAGNGVVSTADNPDLYLIRGQKYRFINNSGGSHPFQIREASGGTAYSTGVTNNGAASGNIDFAPTYDSPAQLVYQCTSHGGMVGNIYLRDAAGNNTNVGVTTFASSATLHTNRIIPVGGVPSGGGGGVIQIVEVGHTTEHTITQTNASSPQQIFSATITPKFSTSKIRIELNIFAYHENYHDGYVGLFKGSASTVITGASQGSYSDVSSIMVRQGTFEDQSSDYQCNPTYYSYLDTAGTTSAITYNIKGLTSNSSYPTYINRAKSRSQSSASFPKLRSTLTLTEYSA